GERLEVLRDVRLALAGLLHHLADVALALHERAEDRQPRRVAQRAELRRHDVEELVGDVLGHGRDRSSTWKYSQSLVPELYHGARGSPQGPRLVSRATHWPIPCSRNAGLTGRSRIAMPCEMRRPGPLLGTGVG